MRALDYGDVASARGASVLVPDYTKTYDAGRNSVAGARGINTDSARTKTFYSDRQTTTKPFDARDFSGSKVARLEKEKFATKSGLSRGKYEIPNATKSADTKTAATSEAREAHDRLAVRSLSDGGRQYLGKEHDKMNTAVDPKTMGDWRSAQTVSYSGTTVETFGSLRELKTVGDVRELLNKNK